jgi:hypothetical protein
MSYASQGYAFAQAQRRVFDRGRRHRLDDNDDFSAAQHEAGHIVCGWLLHLNPTGATIDAGVGYDGKTYFGRAMSKMTDHDLAYARTVCCMAGIEAQSLFGGADDDGGETDAAFAAIAAGVFCRSPAEIDVVIDIARHAARELLKAIFAR